MSLKYPYMDDYMNGRITGWKRSIQTALEKNFGMLKMGTLSLSLSLSLMFYVVCHLLIFKYWKLYSSPASVRVAGMHIQLQSQYWIC